MFGTCGERASWGREGSICCGGEEEPESREGWEYRPGVEVEEEVEQKEARKEEWLCVVTLVGNARYA